MYLWVSLRWLFCWRFGCECKGEDVGQRGFFLNFLNCGLGEIANRIALTPLSENSGGMCELMELSLSFESSAISWTDTVLWENCFGNVGCLIFSCCDLGGYIAFASTGKYSFRYSCFSSRSCLRMKSGMNIEEPLPQLARLLILWLDFCVDSWPGSICTKSSKTTSSIVKLTFRVIACWSSQRLGLCNHLKLLGFRWDE